MLLQQIKSTERVGGLARVENSYSRGLTVIREPINDIQLQQSSLNNVRLLALDNNRESQSFIVQTEAQPANTYQPENRTIYDEMANKLKMEQVLTYEVQRAKRYNRQVALLVITIDQSGQLEQLLDKKLMDDLFASLRDYAQVKVRDMDFVGRPESGMLAVCCPETNKEQAMIAGERLRAALSTFPPRPLYSEIRLTASIGAAVAPDHAREVEGLIRSAVSASRRASSKGGNQVILSI